MTTSEADIASAEADNDQARVDELTQEKDDYLIKLEMAKTAAWFKLLYTLLDIWCAAVLYSFAKEIKRIVGDVEAEKNAKNDVEMAKQAE